MSKPRSKCYICGNTERLFNFPRAKTKRVFLEEWMKFCRMDEATYRKKKLWCLCDRHFADCCYRNELKERLVAQAIPTLNPPVDSDPPPKDRTPSIPGDLKADTFRKIVYELMAKQERNGTCRPYRKYSKYTPINQGVLNLNKSSEEKENSHRTDSVNDCRLESPIDVEPVLHESDVAYLTIDAIRLPVGNKGKLKYITLPLEQSELLSATSPSIVNMSEIESVEQSNPVNNVSESKGFLSSHCESKSSHRRALPSILRRSHPKFKSENPNNVTKNVKSPDSALKTWNNSETILINPNLKSATSIVPESRLIQIVSSTKKSMSTSCKPMPVKLAFTKMNSQSRSLKGVILKSNTPLMSSIELVSNLNNKEESPVKSLKLTSLGSASQMEIANLFNKKCISSLSCELESPNSLSSSLQPVIADVSYSKSLLKDKKSTKSLMESTVTNVNSSSPINSKSTFANKQVSLSSSINKVDFSITSVSKSKEDKNLLTSSIKSPFTNNSSPLPKQSRPASRSNGSSISSMKSCGKISCPSLSTEMVNQPKKLPPEVASCDDVITVDEDRTVSSFAGCNSNVNNKENEKSDLLLTAITNSEISLMDDSLAGEEVVTTHSYHGSIRNESPGKKIKTQEKVKKKKNYYDPVLIDSVLDKMKLKKSGPIRIVTLEKKPDRLFKGFTKNKIVTLYKQRANKSKSSNKLQAGRSVGKKNKSSTDKAEKVLKKRKCTCTLHCRRKINGSKNSPPVINVSSGVGVKYIGAALNSDFMNVDQELSDNDFDNVFNVSTILTNVQDKSQIEQLCQLLIESIFRLKNMNIEGTMGKLQVYISQMPLHSNDELGNKNNSVPQLSSSVNRNEIDAAINSITDIISIDKDVSSSSCSTENNSKLIPTHNKICQSEKDHSGDGVSFDKSPQKHSFLSRTNSTQKKPKQVKVNLSTFHDHNYIKHDSNFIFEKPEYLVKLIDIDTYKRPHKKIKSPLPVISKKELEKHKKTCEKLSNKINRLRELISKKNKNIKSMHRKIKYLGGVVCEQKGIKRVKYPKITESDENQFIIHSVSEYLAPVNQSIPIKVKTRKRKKIDDQFNIEGLTAISNITESSFYNKEPENKVKKSLKNRNDHIESIDTLYENLIEEICYDLEY